VEVRRPRHAFRWTVFAVGLGIALVAHVFYIIPKLISPLLDKPEAPVEIAYIPESNADSTDPKPDEPKADEPKPDKPKPEKEKPKLAAAPAPAEVAEPKPEPPKPEPPKPVEAVKPAPPPPPMPKQRMQMVDQEKFAEEKENLEARFLAQRNHRAEVETRAKETNLIREVESKAKAQTEPNQNHDQDVGGKEQKIAELEARTGPDKSMPRSSPMHGDEGSRANPQQTQRGALSMRDLVPHAAESRPAEKSRDGVELNDPAPGELPLARTGRDAQLAHAAKKGGAAFRITPHMYDEIEGYDTAEKERRQAARAEVSHQKGRYDRYLAKAAAVRSSIENFAFDVKPGNQSELGTRASPFAGYITAMHRQIHKLWTFGFLQDIELRPGKTQYDNQELWTQLQLVIKGDGTVEKVGIVRTSGVLAFDVAAIDSVMSAAPFPTPPQAIKSANGKVYMDWQFHRDDRACGTFGVDPYILTTPGEDQPHDTSETQAGAREAAAKKPVAADPTQLKAPRELKRLARNEEAMPTARPAAPAPSVVVPEVTEDVRAAAEGWFAAYQRGDASWLAGWSATPFVANGQVTARDAAALKSMYKQLLAEAGSRTVGKTEVLTPAGIRGRLHGLPPGGEEHDMLFAVGKAGPDEFILLLKQSNRGWRVAGLAR